MFLGKIWEKFNRVQVSGSKKISPLPKRSRFLRHARHPVTLANKFNGLRMIDDLSLPVTTLSLLDFLTDRAPLAVQHPRFSA